MSGECEICGNQSLDCKCDKKRTNSIFDQVDIFLNVFPKITKEESDLIAAVIMWDNDKKAAFLTAKRMFEENITIKQKSKSRKK